MIDIEQLNAVAEEALREGCTREQIGDRLRVIFLASINAEVDRLRDKVLASIEQDRAAAIAAMMQRIDAFYGRGTPH